MSKRLVLQLIFNTTNTLFLAGLLNLVPNRYDLGSKIDYNGKVCNTNYKHKKSIPFQAYNPKNHCGEKGNKDES